MDKDEMQVKGRIFDLQRFSVHDGPGIRTIVFLKGCRLRCRWCCNPESQEYDIQTMMVQGKPKIIGKDVTVEEVMDEIKKDLPYYRRSGGGVTLSGGEALCQPEFAVALLKACQDYGIHTAMESTGFADFKVIKKYLPYLDVYLMDIKHMNSRKHDEFTTKPNELILENARKIAETGAHLIIRVPVIPTFNHTKEEIIDIAVFAKTLPGVQELHLLPYHRLGQDKYEGLGRKYTLAHLEPLSNEYMEELLEAATASGLQCQIGG
ncbi:MAG: glycyl-radical enzyme activating protein [Anaerocolumna sp.]